MTDHAQLDTVKRYDAGLCECAIGTHVEMDEVKDGNYVTYDDYAQAHAAGRQAGLEEAARMLDRVAAIAASLLDGLQCDHTVGVCCCDDRRTIREAVNLTRAKAKEGV